MVTNTKEIYLKQLGLRTGFDEATLTALNKCVTEKKKLPMVFMDVSNIHCTFFKLILQRWLFLSSKEKTWRLKKIVTYTHQSLKQCLHNLYRQKLLSLSIWCNVQSTHYSSNLFVQTSLKVKYMILQNINKWIIFISLI